MSGRQSISLFLLVLISCNLLSMGAVAQVSPTQFYDTSDDDLSAGGDIFSDFNEDLEEYQVLEDERYYRYGRFFTANFGLGLTSFTGNRGAAYIDNHPSFHLSVNYFFDFQKVFVLGFEYSKHTMFIDTIVNGYRDRPLGAVETSMLRPFAGYKYYMDTSDLGTAITYSNPYFLARVEYWYQTNKFPEREDVSKETGGGIGAGIGFGLEFPIELKESYIGVELLYHSVNFFDRFTQKYREYVDPDDPTIRSNCEKGGCYKDLTGDAYSVMMTYNLNW